jgi:hypothetical protein
MATRALFRNSLWLLLLLCGCAGEKGDSIFAPPVFIRMGDASLRSAGDAVLYRDAPLSGHLFALDQLGDTVALASYSRGRAEGWSRRWWKKGQLLEERYYHSGRKEGVHRGWWENGRLRYVYHFANDEYEGAVQEWSEKGMPYRSFHYRRGHEEGLQQMWWEDGSLRANYVVKGGEQYGLIGRKLCTNAEKNITGR